MAVMHIGAPACGMNAAVRSFVRNCIYRGDTVCGIHDGIEGLIAGNIKKMDWYVCSHNKQFRSFIRISSLIFTGRM